MEIRTIKGVFIETFHDSILGISYGKILTNDTLESVKFPTNLENYKYKYVIQPNFLVEVELVKTRKNWIVKTILNYKTFFEPQDYGDYLNLSEIIKILQKNIMEEQKTNALEFLLSYFEYQKINQEHCQTGINPIEFEKLFQKIMGY